jgi:tetratricopeptide (TPR) repeat protein
MSDEKTNPSQIVVLTEAETNVDLFSQGDLLYWKGEYEKAKEHFQAVLNQPSISRTELARCLNSLGAVNGKLKHYKEAINNYYKQLDILLNLDIPIQQENIARCYMSMGMVYWLEQHYDQAVDIYKEALAVLADTKPASNLISDIYKNMANLYTKKHEFDSALLYFEKALHIDRHHLKEDHPDLGQTYANIGIMYYTKQDYQQAMNYFEKARETWLKSLRPSHVYLQSMEKTIRNVQTKLGMYVLEQLTKEPHKQINSV